MAAIAVHNGNRLFFDAPATVPEVPGVPVPNNPAAEEWWFRSYRREPERTLNLLARCEQIGQKWTAEFFDVLVEVCG